MSKTILRSVPAVPIALVLLWPVTTPANAQGFFQSLFSGGQPSGRRTMPPRRGHIGSRYLPHGQSTPWWQQGRQSRRPSHRHYTAMCVRMCDGYYWPISNRATRSKFYDLAKRCEDSCNGDAKLFYMPSGRSDVKGMTDLSGRAYEHIKTAFLYRKKLVKSCTCKPMPWSYSARAKHMQYAAKDAEKRMRLAQQERRRLAALQQQRLQTGEAQHLDARKPGRTIVESLDDEATTETFAEEKTEQAVAEDSLISLENDSDQASNRTVRVTRRRKRPVIRKHRRRRYSAIRRLYRKPKPNWNSGFGRGKSGKVRPRYRRRRR